MKKFIKINFIVLIIFIEIVTNCINVTAVETQIIEDENRQTEDNKNLDELQKEKSELEKNIENSNIQIGIVQSELSDVLIKIEEISLNISNKNAEIDKLEIENEKLDIYINNVTKDLEKITEDYNTKKDNLDKRLVASYQSGKTSYLDVLLNSKDLISFLSNYYLLSEIIEADNKLLDDCDKAQKYMTELEKTLEENRTKLEANKANIQKNKISLENMEAVKKNRLKELSESEESLYKQIEEYQNEIDEVEKSIRRLTLANVGSEYIGGKMAWPVPGYTKITSPFGMRTHPITGIYKLHTGTDIGAPYGAIFVAANDGVVLKAEYNSAYGNMVIIDHGGGITTLYAHGSQILVSPGEYVAQGTPVLKVGSTGYSTGPHAHFEVRVNGEYKNPLDYITSYSNSNTESTNEPELVILNN